MTDAALDQKARQLGLAMGDEDIAKTIFSDPSFKGPNGQFDRARFNDVLRNYGYSERAFINEQRQSYLRQEILQAVAGNIAVPGQTKLLPAQLGGVGGLDAQQLRAETVDLDMTGLGGASVYAKTAANVNLSGMGSATVYGKPATRNATTNGFGKVSWQ